MDDKIDKKKSNQEPQQKGTTDNTSYLMDIFSENAKIDQINSEISSIDEQIIDQELGLATTAISTGDLSKAEELLKTLKQKLPTKGSKFDALKKIYKDFQIKTVDTQLQTLASLYEEGKYLEAETLGKKIYPINTEQTTTHDRYQKLLKDKKDEVRRQQEEIDKQRIQEMITEFPNILMTKSTKEIQNHIDEINDTISKIHFGSLIERYKNFPNKEIYEALQKCYIDKKIEALNHIIALNHPLCNTITIIIGASRVEERILKQYKKDLDKILGIHRQLLGIGGITIDPRTDQEISDLKRFESSHEPDIFLDEIFKYCKFPKITRMGNKVRWQRKRSRDGKYINIHLSEYKVSEVQNLENFIDNKGLDTTDIPFKSRFKFGLDKLKQYLKGKRIISRETNNGGRVLEIV